MTGAAMADDAATLTFEDEDAVYDEFLARGWGDGLPVIAPTHQRVDTMLEHWGREPDEVLLTVPPSNAELTCRGLAVNAVMAGCKGMYLPYVEAALLAMTDEGYNLATVQTTTGPISPLVLVNGPGATAVGMNRATGAMGSGNRANATIGRAVRLVLANVGDAQPWSFDRASSGLPTKYSWCVAENEDASPWEPFHTTRGYPNDADVVTVVGGHGPITVSDSGDVPGEQVLAAFAAAPATVGTNLWFQRRGQLLLLMAPDLASRVARDGYDRPAVQRYVFEHARLSAGQLRRSGSYAPSSWPEEYVRCGDHQLIPIVESPDDILVVVVGGPGPYAHVVPTHGICGRSSSREVVWPTGESMEEAPR
jgi:hypothetical protein